MIYLAKELHFPRALPPRNRREAQGCEIKITDELHHGVFFFLIFCDVLLNISFLSTTTQSPLSGRLMEFLAQCTHFF